MAKQARSPWQSKQDDLSRVREEKRLAVLRTGAEEFRERGYERTSLDDIARKLGVTKPTLYYYITDKQDIVFGCAMLASKELIALCKTCESEKTGLDALTAFFRRYIEIIAGDYGYCLAMIDENLMAAESAKALRKAKRELNTTVCAMLDRGVEDGSIAPCDTKLVSFAFFGAFNWIARWHSRSSSATSTEAIANVFTALFVNGIGGRNKRTSRRPGGPK